MKIKILLFTLAIFLFISEVKAQWQPSNNLSNLNSWSSQAGFIDWYEVGGGPAGQGYGNGIQMVLSRDNRFGAQLVIPTFDKQMYYRRYVNGTWDEWVKMWSSANLNSVQHDFSAKNVTINGVMKLYNKYNENAEWDNIQIWSTGENSFLESNGDENGLIIRSNTGHKILLMDNVGIGTSTPNEKLSVNGKIRAHEIKVEAANWPDYVFDQDYKILGLQELDAYIKTNKHLPEVPSAKEVEANGIALGELVKLQQKKIEELTLHLIDKDKEIGLLKNDFISTKQLVQQMMKDIQKLKTSQK